MAFTIASLERFKFGNGFGVGANATFDASYATGGLSLTPAMLGLNKIDNVYFEGQSGYIFEYDNTNQKIIAYTPVKAQTAHTHAVALDTGVSAAEAAHTHAILLDTGSSAAGSSHTHAATTPGVMGQTIVINPAASVNTDAENTDAGSETTNGHAVAALATVAAGAWAVGAITQMQWPRNICISIQNDSGGPLNLYEGVMTFTVTGTFRGAAQSETITFTSTAGNKAVATANWRVKYGSKPFDTITTIALDNVPDDGLKISAGPGSKLALMHTLKTPAEADIIKYLKNDTLTDVTGKVDTTNGTVLLDTVAATDDFYFYYLIAAPITAIAAEAAHTHGPGTLADAASGAGSSHTHGPGTLADAASGTGGAISAAAASEVTASTDLHTLTIRIIAFGV